MSTTAHTHRRLHLLSIDVPKSQLELLVESPNSTSASSVTPASTTSASSCEQQRSIKQQRRQSTIAYNTSPDTSKAPIGLSRSSSLSHRPQPTQVKHDRRQSIHGGGSPMTITETYAPLLHYIAAKEAKCLELRSALESQESELAILKRKWEKIVSRHQFASTSPPSRPTRPNGPPASVVRGGMRSSSESSDRSRSSFDDQSTCTSISTAPTSPRQSPSPSPGPKEAPIQTQPIPTTSPLNIKSRPRQRRIILQDLGAPVPFVNPALSRDSTSSISTSNSSARSSAAVPGTSLASFMPSLNDTLDKLIYPTLNMQLEKAVERMLSPKQKRRMSGVLEGVFGVSLPSSFASKRDEDEEEDTIRQPLPVTPSISASSSALDMSNLPPTPESSERDDELGRKMKLHEEEEDSWNW